MYLSYTSAQTLVDELTAVEKSGTLWLLCFSDQHADQLPPFFETAADQGLRFCGGIFPGLIYDNQRRDEGVIAIPLHPKAQLITGSLDPHNDPRMGKHQAVSSDTTDSALLFMDSQSPGISGFMEAIFDQFGTRVHFAGAGAGYRDLRQAPSIFSESGFIEHGSLLILLPHPSTVNVRHGWKRVAGPFIATRTNGKIIQELNWEAAGSFYRKEVEALAPDLKDKPVFPDLVSRFPLSIGKQAAEDVVRDPFGINHADEILCLSDVPENSAIYISEGSKDSLIDAAQQAVTDCAKADPVSICFISDCYSRALMLGDELTSELDKAGTALKNITDSPFQGVLALGEICGNGHSSLEFYNKTFLVALLHE